MGKDLRKDYKIDFQSKSPFPRLACRVRKGPEVFFDRVCTRFFFLHLKQYITTHCSLAGLKRIMYQWLLYTWFVFFWSLLHLLQLIMSLHSRRTTVHLQYLYLCISVSSFSSQLLLLVASLITSILKKKQNDFLINSKCQIYCMSKSIKSKASYDTAPGISSLVIRPRGMRLVHLCL